MSDLLKNAIADAKAVRATALANAKAALEEAFAPKLQSMLSEKLKAEIGEDEVPVADAAPVETEPVGTDVEAPAPAEEAPVPAVEAPAPEAEEEMEEEMEEARGTESAGHVDVTQHGVSHVTEGEKASDDYKTTTTGHATEDKGQEVVDATKLSTAGEPKAAADSHKASDDYKKVTAGHKTEDPQGGPKVVKLEEEIDEASLEEILKELEDSVNESGVEEVAQEAAASDQVDEEISLEELLSEDEVSEEKVEEGIEDLKKWQEKHGKGKKDDEETNESIVKENLSLKKEIEEYRGAIKYLRDQINEVNLLNAKLLYTNKLFKQTNLNNEQKLKVIESFDLTKSVREAKIVYATLAESFNFGAKKAAEPVKASATVKTITEGLASKAVASTKPTKPTVLVEGAEMANRFKKLAGIQN
jgi:hypothetical protein